MPNLNRFTVYVIVRDWLSIGLCLHVSSKVKSQLWVTYGAPQVRNFLRKILPLWA